MNVEKLLKGIGEDIANVIGTDVSLEVCINEGYLMAIPKEGGNYRIIQFTPDYIVKESNHTIKGLMIDAVYSVSDLIERYHQYKRGIDSFIGGTHSENEEDYKTVHDVLWLADSIVPYCGLD